MGSQMAVGTLASDGRSAAIGSRSSLKREDRTLLSRMAAVNRSLGEITIRILAGLDDGDLNVADLRSVGRELTSLGADMLQHADTMDHVIESETN
ncbi:MAG TPA: hypothetical protein VHW44_12160 [Pseudonocardiaceae bacterium]|jgi:hypothetical protein|nr:hypothetical protein [Pseudonocardiaceae bacterium]